MYMFWLRCLCRSYGDRGWGRSVCGGGGGGREGYLQRFRPISVCEWPCCSRVPLWLVDSYKAQAELLILLAVPTHTMWAFESFHQKYQVIPCQISPASNWKYLQPLHSGTFKIAVSVFCVYKPTCCVCRVVRREGYYHSGWSFSSGSLQSPVIVF